MVPAIKVFVISLIDQQDRRAVLVNRLSPILKFEFVDAIRGSHALAEEAGAGFTRQLYSGRMGRKLTPAEIGCSLSHRKALEKFLQSGSKWGLILEDDVEISLNQRDMIVDLIDLMADHADCDLVKVGGFGDKTSLGLIIAQGTEFSVLNVVTFGVCSHAYIVSQRGAAKIVRALEPITEPFDTFLRSAYRHECKIFETAPWLVSLQTDHFVSSTIIPERRSPNGHDAPFYLKLIGSFDKRFYNLRKWRHGIRHFGLRFVFKKKMLTQLSTTDHPRS